MFKKKGKAIRSHIRANIVHCIRALNLALGLLEKGKQGNKVQ